MMKIKAVQKAISSTEYCFTHSIAGGLIIS